MSAAPNVVFALPDKMGGVFSYVQDLFRYRSPSALPYLALRTASACDPDARSRDRLGPQDIVFEHALPFDNIHTVMRRLGRAIGSGPGALVANDWLELAFAHWMPQARTVISVVHGDFDYYYALALRHEPVIDVYVAYTERVHSRLCELLPARHADIRLLRYGVPIPETARADSAGRLRLLYAGRLHADKGIFMLPEIDRLLRQRGIDVQWTIHGEGPDAGELKRMWPADGTRIQYSSYRPLAEVRALYATADVFVLPSRYEALPVALLEAGAAGVVPVVSDLPSGMPEVVETGGTGYRVPVGDTDAFARAIAELERDRAALRRMSAGVRRLVSARYDVRTNSLAYEALFSDWERLRRPRPGHLRFPYGSRLDHPWVPNVLVRALRRARGSNRLAAS